MSEWTSMEESWFAPYESRQQERVRLQLEVMIEEWKLRDEMYGRMREANLHPAVRITDE